MNTDLRIEAETEGERLGELGGSNDELEASFEAVVSVDDEPETEEVGGASRELGRFERAEMGRWSRTPAHIDGDGQLAHEATCHHIE